MRAILLSLAVVFAGCSALPEEAQDESELEAEELLLSGVHHLGPNAVFGMHRVGDTVLKIQPETFPLNGTLYQVAIRSNSTQTVTFADVPTTVTGWGGAMGCAVHGIISPAPFAPQLVFPGGVATDEQIAFRKATMGYGGGGGVHVRAAANGEMVNETFQLPQLSAGVGLRATATEIEMKAGQWLILQVGGDMALPGDYSVNWEEQISAPSGFDAYLLPESAIDCGFQASQIGSDLQATTAGSGAIVDGFVEMQAERAASILLEPSLASGQAITANVRFGDHQASLTAVGAIRCYAIGPHAMEATVTAAGDTDLLWMLSDAVLAWALLSGTC